MAPPINNNSAKRPHPEGLEEPPARRPRTQGFNSLGSVQPLPSTTIRFRIAQTVTFSFPGTLSQPLALRQIAVLPASPEGVLFSQIHDLILQVVKMEAYLDLLQGRVDSALQKYSLALRYSIHLEDQCRISQIIATIYETQQTPDALNRAIDHWHIALMAADNAYANKLDILVRLCQSLLRRGSVFDLSHAASLITQNFSTASARQQVVFAHLLLNISQVRFRLASQ